MAARPLERDRRRLVRGLPRVALTTLTALAALAGPGSLAAAAAAPTPSPATTSSVQAWLDAPFITPDAPPGGVLEAGVTFWDPATNDFAALDGVFARLRPAKGKAAASEGSVSADFPGHVVMQLVVPKGGPGSLVIGVHTAAGDEMIPLSGIGPPPTATADQLVAATFHPFVGSVVAGRPYPVVVDVQPRGQWDLAEMPSLDGLSVVASVGGRQVASAPLVEDAAPGTPFRGQVTVPDPGAAELSVALFGPDGSTSTVAGAAVTVTAAAGDRPTTPPGSTASPPPAEEGVPMIAWLVLAALAVGLVGAIAWRTVRER